MAFPPLRHSDHVIVSVSTDFQSNSKQNALYCIACNYFCAGWDGLCYHSKDVPWENIFKLSSSAAATDICGWVQVGIDA